MTYTLQRTTQSDEGTFGAFSDPMGTQLCVTCERPPTGDHPCIPQGVYDVEAYESPTHGQVWQIMNVPNRTNIEIHAANWPAQLLGCIAVGESIDLIMGVMGVSNSDATLIMLRNTLPKAFELAIFDPTT